MSERLPMHNPRITILEGIAMRGTHYDLHALQTQDVAKYETDFWGDTIDGLLATGGAGTAAALVSSGANGTVNLDTGASDNQASVLYLPNGQVKGDLNPVLDVWVKVDSIATGDVQIGFADSAASGVLTGSGVGPIVSPLTDPPTLVGSTADAVVATYDLSSALTNPSYWRLAGSRASTAWLVTPTTTAASLVAPTAGTYQRITLALYRQDLGTDDMGAVLYVNNVEVARQNTGAVSNTAALWPFVLISATSAAARVLTLDYFGLRQHRDPTLFA